MHELMMDGTIRTYLIFHAKYNNNGLEGHSYVFEFTNGWGGFVSTDYNNSDLWEIQLVRISGAFPVDIEFELRNDEVLKGGYEYGLNDREICEKLYLIRKMDYCSAV